MHSSSSTAAVVLQSMNVMRKCVGIPKARLIDILAQPRNSPPPKKRGKTRQIQRRRLNHKIFSVSVQYSNPSPPSCSSGRSQSPTSSRGSVAFLVIDVDDDLPAFWSRHDAIYCRYDNGTGSSLRRRTNSGLCLGAGSCHPALHYHLVILLSERVPFAAHWKVDDPERCEPECSSSPLTKSTQARNIWEIINKLFSVLNSTQMGIDSFTQYLHISLPCDSWLLLNSRHSHPSDSVFYEKQTFPVNLFLKVCTFFLYPNHKSDAPNNTQQTTRTSQHLFSTFLAIVLWIIQCVQMWNRTYTSNDTTQKRWPNIQDEQTRHAKSLEIRIQEEFFLQGNR